MTFDKFDYFNLTGVEIDQYANLDRNIAAPHTFVWEYSAIMTMDQVVLGIVWNYPNERLPSISVLLEDPVTKVFHAVFTDKNFSNMDYAQTALIREVRRIWSHECLWSVTK